MAIQPHTTVQLSEGDSHGKFVVEELEVALCVLWYSDIGSV
jgi:hypothetical protein